MICFKSALNCRTYNKQWADAQAALSDLLVYENVNPEARKPEKVFLNFSLF